MASVRFFLLWALAGGRPETLVDLRDPHLASGYPSRPVHGAAGLGAYLDTLQGDGFLALTPFLHLDFSERAPVFLTLGAPVRFRLWDQSPSGSGVVRGRDWDEVGDVLSVLRAFGYHEAFAFGAHGSFRIDLRLGRFRRARLRHGSLVADLDAGADLDRPRSGADLAGQVEGRLAGQRAALGWQLLATDLAGGQVIGGALGLSWAGAYVGAEVAGDPTAPRRLQRDRLAPDRFTLEDGRRIVAEGPAGALGVAAVTGYVWTDDWRVYLFPHLAGVFLPGLGRGLEVAVDTELRLGPARRVRLALDAVLTVGDAGYEPEYFGPLYVAERWQMPLAAAGGPVAGDDPVPKWTFVREADLAGVGGRGRMALGVGEVLEIQATYARRPGPLGGRFDLGVSVNLPAASLSGRYVHRGRHGFELYDPAGTLARLALSLPVLPYLDVDLSAALAFATWRDEEAQATGPVGYMGGAGFFRAGIAGKIPW